MARLHNSTQGANISQTRLRQIALLAKDLSAAEDILKRVLGTEVIFRDDQVAKWGLYNFLMPLGGDLIEVVSPFRDGTTAGRLLKKRGDGGYMIIMQTSDAAARKDFIESRGLSKVIFSFSKDDVDCVQYHPKGIPGSVIPELDSHKPSPENREPVLSTFSPWHACGLDYQRYSAAMARSSYLQIIQVTCRLAAGENDPESAAQKWEHIFGVQSKGSELVFTNMRMSFVKGVDGLPEGLESITVGVYGESNLNRILERAQEEGIYENGAVAMLGIQWYFSPLSNDVAKSKI
ncbi:hypothetical protein BGW36DRAFT_384090 [Talaromyces proteolyticus]|uniref:Glyoxalase-like domain-containing protein n=1 Tax=Talaromyces proteolyticus TaxID=1131652 RepID=A0AAD4KL99_9EURO|nr:uncharacterized protein BGW36DRAFT_384090 [Talaromyces proteolyticus]KAH8693988.1 hypothetical protein BGW36DRAFT_384090 [Talaromyces proteolyticus]